MRYKLSMIVRLAFCFLLAFFISGCGNFSRTPDDFRKFAREHERSAKVIKLSVKRSFADVNRSLRRGAAKCMSSFTSAPNAHQGDSPQAVKQHRLTPTFIKGVFHSELHLQHEVSGDRSGGWFMGHGGRKAPEGGWYVVVVDVDKMRAQLTRVKIYGPKDGPLAGMPDAIEGWVTTGKVSCMDV